MQAPPGYDLIRYLTVKKAIDDRSLNGHVWDVFEALTRKLMAELSPCMLEAGCGVGTMVARLLERGVLRRGRYVGIDADGILLEAAVERMSRLRGFVRLPSTGETGAAFARGWAQELRVDWRTADLFAFRGPPAQRDYDLILAHAFLDLVPLGPALDIFRQLLRPGGLLYLTLNFDGATILEPVVEEELDRLIERAYHGAMDEDAGGSGTPGGARTGRLLPAALDARGIQVLASGSSDWVVTPAGGCYPGEEAYFLHYIIECVHRAVQGRAGIDGTRLAKWVRTRHEQVERAGLTYIAHQVDLLARVPEI